MALPASDLSSQVAASLARTPIIGVVRTSSIDEARRQAIAFASGGIELVEITFTVPDAVSLVRELLAHRVDEGRSLPWIGMGTVTNSERAHAAIAAGSEFLVTPNVHAEVARIAREAGRFLVLGALTPTEIVAASELGADVIKVYPLPPVGGPSYLATVRQPLGDLPLLAAGGFDIEEIPAYARAGAVAFGIGAPLLGVDDESTQRRIAHAIELARFASGKGNTL